MKKQEEKNKKLYDLALPVVEYLQKEFDKQCKIEISQSGVKIILELHNISCDVVFEREKQPVRQKYFFEEHHMVLAKRMADSVLKRFPTQKINLDQWADSVRKIIEIDGKSREQLIFVWSMIIKDDRPGFCWADNCRSPMKLRDRKDGLQYFDLIVNQLSPGGSGTRAICNDVSDQEIRVMARSRMATDQALDDVEVRTIDEYIAEIKLEYGIE